MGKARRSTARIGGWIALAVVMAAALTVTAYALTRGAKHPPKRPLAVAIHEALTAGPVAGVRAEFSVSQHLLPGASSLFDRSLTGGAHGTLWASGDRVKLVVRSRLGTVVAGYDGSSVTVYVPKQHAAFRLAVPHHSDAASHEGGSPPSVAEIRTALARLGRTFDFSGAIPGNVAGRPAYTVRVSLRHDAGVVGPLALAWDAVHGTPLRLALYPRGSSRPAIALQVSHIHYGSLSAQDTTVHLPAGTAVTPVHLPTRGEIRHALKHAHARVHGSVAPLSAVPPAVAGGLPRTVARSFSGAKGSGLVAVYGRGLGSVLVIERKASARAAHAGAHDSILPSVRINGTRGAQLTTTLGTVVTFTRSGTEYIVLGARAPSTVLAVARALS
jgi:hypothetical protein